MDLSSNNIGDDGMSVIKDVLAVNKTLRKLNMNGNDISLTEVMAVADMLKRNYGELNDNEDLQAKAESKLSQLSKVMANINESKVKLRRSKIMIVGEGFAGKTAFANSIIGKDFKETESTVGINTFMCSVNYAALNKGEWNESAKVKNEYENGIVEKLASDKMSDDDDREDDDHDDDDDREDSDNRSVRDAKIKIATDTSFNIKGRSTDTLKKYPNRADSTDVENVKKGNISNVDNSKVGKDMLVKSLASRLKIGENILISILDYGGQSVFNVSAYYSFF